MILGTLLLFVTVLTLWYVLTDPDEGACRED